MAIFNPIEKMTIFFQEHMVKVVSHPRSKLDYMNIDLLFEFRWKQRSYLHLPLIWEPSHFTIALGIGSLQIRSFLDLIQ